MSLIEPLEIFTWDAVSGMLQITAPKVKNFSAGSVSGAVSLSVEEEPETLSIRTTSGSIDLAFPEDESFTLDYDSTSGELSSDLAHRTESGQYFSETEKLSIRLAPYLEMFGSQWSNKR